MTGEHGRRTRRVDHGKEVYYIVRLTDAERKSLREVIGKLKGSSQKVRRAQLLPKADADGPNWTDRKIAEAFSCRTQTVKSLRQRLAIRRFDSESGIYHYRNRYSKKTIFFVAYLCLLLKNLGKSAQQIRGSLFSGKENGGQRCIPALAVRPQNCFARECTKTNRTKWDAHGDDATITPPVHSRNNILQRSTSS